MGSPLRGCPVEQTWWRGYLEGLLLAQRPNQGHKPCTQKREATGLRGRNNCCAFDLNLIAPTTNAREVGRKTKGIGADNPRHLRHILPNRSHGCTMPTLSTPLQAMYTRPSFVAAMLRTTPPPDGISALANVSVFGSKRTIVFGFTPYSLYHTMPSGVMVMPYGFDSGPPGEFHSFTSRVFGASLPRCPLLKSEK